MNSELLKTTSVWNREKRDNCRLEKSLSSCFRFYQFTVHNLRFTTVIGKSSVIIKLYLEYYVAGKKNRSPSSIKSTFSLKLLRIFQKETLASKISHYDRIFLSTIDAKDVIMP